MVSGECKRRMPVEHLEGRKKKGGGKFRARKPLAARVTQTHPGQNFNGTIFSNINDEAMEQVGEFMQWVNLAEPAGPASETVSVQSLVNISGLAPPAQEEDEEDIRELSDMGAMARDLVRRIQRLRRLMRPGSAARSALPDLRMDGDEDEMASAELGVDVDAPVVAGMD
jgi:hypothetical protein